LEKESHHIDPNSLPVLGKRCVANVTFVPIDLLLSLSCASALLQPILSQLTRPLLDALKDYYPRTPIRTCISE
jgi:hypothetical protein